MELYEMVSYRFKLQENIISAISFLKIQLISCLYGRQYELSSLKLKDMDGGEQNTSWLHGLLFLWLPKWGNQLRTPYLSENISLLVLIIIAWATNTEPQHLLGAHSVGGTVLDTCLWPWMSLTDRVPMTLNQSRQWWIHKQASHR